MNYAQATALPLLLFVLPCFAGTIEETIFKSGFEFNEGCTIFDGSSDHIDIRSVLLTGDLTLNGGPFPQSEQSDGWFSLRDRVTGDVFPLAKSDNPSYANRVVAGHYDLLYSVESPGAGIPRNEGAVVMEDVALLQDTVLDINLVAYEISGDYLLNGDPFPASAQDHGYFLLVSESAGRVEVGDSNDMDFTDVMVLPGDYEVRYQSDQASNVTPANKFGLVGQLLVSGDADSLELQVQSVEISGNFTQNFQAFPASQYADGDFYLETTAGDRAYLGNSYDGVYTRYIIPGTYDAYWELETPDDLVPVNERARVGTNLVAAAGTLNINVASNQVSGAFTLAGNAFPNTPEHTGQIVLWDEVANTESVLALTHEGGYQRRIIKGNYDVVYQHLQGEQVPRNLNAVLQQDVLIASGADRDVDVPSGFISVNVTHNGQPFMAPQGQFGNIRLRHEATGDDLILGRTSAQQPLSAKVIPGTYNAYYQHIVGDQVPQNQMGLIQKNVVVQPSGPVFLAGGDGVLGGADVLLQVNSMVVSGQMRNNEVLMPADPLNDGLMSLQWNEDYLLLGYTHDQTYTARVLVSTYWSHYAVETKNSNLVPANEDARISCAILVPKPL